MTLLYESYWQKIEGYNESDVALTLLLLMVFPSETHLEEWNKQLIKRNIKSCKRGHAIFVTDNEW